MDQPPVTPYEPPRVVAAPPLQRIPRWPLLIVGAILLVHLTTILAALIFCFLRWNDLSLGFLELPLAGVSHVGMWTMVGCPTLMLAVAIFLRGRSVAFRLMLIGAEGLLMLVHFALAICTFPAK